MRTIIFTFFYFAITTITSAQDPRLQGVWKYHFDSYYDESVEVHIIPSWDDYLRIDIGDDEVFISMKRVGKYGNGTPYTKREEPEDIRVNEDGSISFKKYLIKKDYNEDDHLYHTMWWSYTVKYSGGRLVVVRDTNVEYYNSNGNLVKSSCHEEPEKIIYFNEKDNW